MRERAVIKGLIEELDMIDGIVAFSHFCHGSKCAQHLKLNLYHFNSYIDIFW